MLLAFIIDTGSVSKTIGSFNSIIVPVNLGVLPVPLENGLLISLKYDSEVNTLCVGVSENGLVLVIAIFKSVLLPDGNIFKVLSKGFI